MINEVLQTSLKAISTTGGVQASSSKTIVFGSFPTSAPTFSAQTCLTYFAPGTEACSAAITSYSAGGTLGRLPTTIDTSSSYVNGINNISYGYAVTFFLQAWPSPGGAYPEAHSVGTIFIQS
jgi:hypothetical protein